MIRFLLHWKTHGRASTHTHTQVVLLQNHEQATVYLHRDARTLSHMQHTVLHVSRKSLQHVLRLNRLKDSKQVAGTERRKQQDGVKVCAYARIRGEKGFTEAKHLLHDHVPDPVVTHAHAHTHYGCHPHAFVVQVRHAQV